MRQHLAALMRTAATALLLTPALGGQINASVYCDSNDFPPVERTQSPFLFLNDYTLKAFGGVDHFRGIPDGEYSDNNGLIVGLETALPIPYLGCYGFGMQFGGSYGAYDFVGRSFAHTTKSSKEMQSQGFLTFGAFKRPMPLSPWTLGFAYDVMLNKNFGVYAKSPTLTQWRALLGCFISDFDEIGLWVSWSGRPVHKHKTYYKFCRNTLSYKAIPRLDIFWRHIYKNDVQSKVWVGFPYEERLNTNLSRYAARFLVGGEINVPFCDNFEIDARAQYVYPSTKRGLRGSRDYSCNVAVEIVYNFGGNCTARPASAPWNPYLPLANNSNFIVDAKSETKLLRR